MRVVDDVVGENSKPLDLDFNDIAGVKQPRRRPRIADAGRRTGCEEIASMDRKALGNVGQSLANSIDHLRSASLLHDPAIHACFDLKSVPEVSDLHHTWQPKLRRFAGAPRLTV